MLWLHVLACSASADFSVSSRNTALEIKRNKTGPDDHHGINPDYGQYVKTNTWDSLLHHHNIMGSSQANNERTTQPTSINETTALTTTVSETATLSTSHNNEPE